MQGRTQSTLWSSSRTERHSDLLQKEITRKEEGEAVATSPDRVPLTPMQQVGELEESFKACPNPISTGGKLP